MPTHLFIITCVAFMALWDLPFGVRLKRVARRAFRPAHWLGLGHSWAMYAPNPPDHTLFTVFRGSDGGETVDLTPRVFGTADDLRRARSLRFVTLQRNLAFEQSAPVRQGICRLLRGRGHRQVEVIRASLETPPLGSDSSQSRPLRFDSVYRC